MDIFLRLTCRLVFLLPLQRILTLSILMNIVVTRIQAILTVHMKKQEEGIHLPIKIIRLINLLVIIILHIIIYLCVIPLCKRVLVLNICLHHEDLVIMVGVILEGIVWEDHTGVCL